MHVESMNVTWRTRSIWEGCDLGVRLLQENLWPVFRCHLAVALPVFGVCALTNGIAPWLPALLVWWLKPFLDRPVLYALSRALFGTPTLLAGPRPRRLLAYVGFTFFGAYFTMVAYAYLPVLR